MKQFNIPFRGDLLLIGEHEAVDLFKKLERELKNANIDPATYGKAKTDTEINAQVHQQLHGPRVITDS